MPTPLRAAVIGSPVSHSLSPALHRAAYEGARRPWRYDTIEVTPEQLPAFLQTCGSRWLGLSLTMPLKEAVIPLLTDIDDVGRLTRSVNTVILPGSPEAGNRTPRGYNTDVAGIVTAIAETGTTSAHTATVLGAGATARSAVVAAARLSARRLQVSARRRDAMEDLAQLARTAGFTSVELVDWQQAQECLGSDVVISTVPKGAVDWLAADASGSTGTLLDVVYDPWPTPLATSWAGPVVPGLAMLLWQAVVQIRLWGGFEPDVEAMRAAVGLTPPAP